jgi:hypothetical protein
VKVNYIHKTLRYIEKSVVVVTHVSHSERTCFESLRQLTCSTDRTFSHGFFVFLLANAEIVPTIRPRLPPSKSLPAHESLSYCHLIPLLEACS